MKGYLLDVVAGWLSGIGWLLLFSEIGNKLMLELSLVEAMIFVWFVPGLLIFLVYRKLPIFAKTHMNARKTAFYSFACFFILGFLGLAYFSYGLISAVIFYSLW